MKFTISANTPDGPVAFQTGSPEAALDRARILADEEAQEVRVTDMHGRVYETDAFDGCFVRSQASSRLDPEPSS
ncbi:hypothetical protein [Methylobacterium soli]|uniref:Uncharacterized protein n=1 Tax=Methylobacterium soli TaxID=553447 RepID=A0A6L3T5X4_9HYPH|nr:hypothetical protein [Methylobacterium soli]KAB1080699.1 hypothetical protein F6X53_05870 [Methylobacterium soli]GJE42283.1 hypothetical protein AEGHOMDF_1455 [Methylobacterium soli]